MMIKVSTLDELFMGMLLLSHSMADAEPEEEPEPFRYPDDEREPFLFPDEIAEILRNAGDGADVMIGHARWTYYAGFMHDALVEAIYDAIEEGRRVTIDGKNILDM